MELQRRIGHGRLSEIFGETTLPQDRFLRTVGFGRAARSAWAGLPDWAKQQTDAYIAGVNAFIATHHGSQLPPEFSLLRFEPEPWTGPDVVVWVKMMAWDLSSNYVFELLRRDLTIKVGPEKMAQLMPPYPRDGLSILVDRENRRGGPGAAQATQLAPSTATGPRTLDPDTPTFSYTTALAAALNSGEPAIRDFLRGAHDRRPRLQQLGR